MIIEVKNISKFPAKLNFFITYGLHADRLRFVGQDFIACSRVIRPVVSLRPSGPKPNHRTMPKRDDQTQNHHTFKF